MFSKGVAEYEGLLLVQSKDTRLDAAIHMFFCNFDLAIFWINDQMQVVDRCLARRWRPWYAPKSPARYTVEAHPDRFEDFQIGDSIVFNNEDSK
jgi:uncharacterized membrane protein (UPF0127 family)